MRRTITLIAAALLLATSVYAQDVSGMHPSTQKKEKPARMAEPTKAVAVLNSAPGMNVQGTVTFEQVEGGVKVTADVTGLTPGKHGFHIHAYGDCSAGDFTSTGGHLMAPGEKHAGPDDPDRHIGDMGNITADASGKAHLELVDSKLSFSGPYSILGRAIIIHAGEDDLTSQPTGNAGGRVACGTIGLAK